VARRDQARVARGRVGAERVRAFDELDLGSVAREVVRRGHADDPAAEHDDLHQ